jgi:CTP:molybdopterin cytidylyltransferase MocA
VARIEAVLLAAGQSIRFGGPKLLAETGNGPLLRRQVDELLSAPVERLLVVVGAFAREYRACLPPDTRVEVIEHPGWAAGLGSSIAAGFGQLAAGVDGAVITLADQPALRAGLIAEMIGKFEGEPHCVVACRYAGVLGPPALFGREWFPALMALRGEEGARRVLTQAGSRVRTIEWPEGAFDLDTREDWEAWKGNS